MSKRNIAIYLSTIGILFLITFGWYTSAFISQPTTSKFDGQRALSAVETQLAFGPRIPGSAGHARAIEWIRSELSAAGWETRIQSAEVLDHPINNIVAFRGPDQPTIIIAAHYDTRIYADQDPDPSKWLEPVPGANDGASGVAVLLELGRVLPIDSLPIWLVFFDAEDNGRIQGWDWILGSRAFLEELEFIPEAVVIVDMIGDVDLNIYKERNSDQELVNEIWDIASDLGYEEFFISEEKYSILDDHTPFLEQGISAIDIIDFDYPYWHTTSDSFDKVSATSLNIIGDVLLSWVLSRNNPR
ncbi:MAG: M28 family peptidase [Anaerolineae bacterium]|nr:M28 family peptidase [Anaerolineae bacterium]MDK1080076.1 M28 family peptidase [Anaerolineae bacterium]